MPITDKQLQNRVTFICNRLKEKAIKFEMGNRFDLNIEQLSQLKMPFGNGETIQEVMTKRKGSPRNNIQLLIVVKRFYRLFIKKMIKCSPYEQLRINAGKDLYNIGCKYIQSKSSTYVPVFSFEATKYYPKIDWSSYRNDFLIPTKKDN